MNNIYLRTKKSWQLPIVPINQNLNPFQKQNVQLWGVLGYRLPYGTMKIFAVLSLLQHAKKLGKLKNVKRLIEATSGAYGLVLAQFAKDIDFNVPEVVLVMNKDILPGKKLPPLYAGAIIMPPLEGLSTIATARKLGGGGWKSDDEWNMAEDGTFNLDQYGNIASTWLYRDWMSPKIAKQIPQGFEILVSPVGTGGTIIGLSEYFRKKQPNVKIIGAMVAPGEKIPGGRSLADMKEINLPWRSALDEIVEVESIPAYLAALQFQRHTGMMIGITSGEAYIAALLTLRRYFQEGKIDSLRKRKGQTINVLIIFHDGFRPYGASELPIPNEYLKASAPMPWELLW